MEQRNNRCNQNGNIPWTLLPRVLLALFSNHGIAGMDEYHMDGCICHNNFWRKNLAQGHLDRKVCWNRSHYLRNIEQSGVNNII